MDTFSYLSVFYSVVVGLLITRILTGFGELITARNRIRWYHPFVGWGAFLLLFAAFEWWVIFRWRSHETWSFPLFAFLAVRPSLLYLSSHILFPQLDAAEHLDLKQRFFQVRGWVLGLIAGAVAAGVLDTALKGADYFARVFPRQWPFTISFLSGAALGIVSSNHRLLNALPWLMCVLLIVALSVVR